MDVGHTAPSNADADDLGLHGGFDLVGVFFPPVGEFRRYTYRVYGRDPEGRYVSARSSEEPSAGEQDAGAIRGRLQREAGDDVRAMIDAIEEGHEVH